MGFSEIRFAGGVTPVSQESHSICLRPLRACPSPSPELAPPSQRVLSGSGPGHGGRGLWSAAGAHSRGVSRPHGGGAWAP